jgi:guanylate kinase
MPTAQGVRGSVYVVSAASGAGKTSLVRALVESTEGIAATVSYTTRPPRPGEEDGAHYRFVDAAGFQALLARDELLEHAEVHGHRYGTSRQAVLAGLQAGRDVVLTIDWQGFQQVRSRMPDAVGIFLLPPSRAELERRLRGRGQDSDAVIARRLANARAEMAHWAEYDYLIVNASFEDALADLAAVVRARRLGRPGQGVRLGALLAELLAENP